MLMLANVLASIEAAVPEHPTHCMAFLYFIIILFLHKIQLPYLEKK